MSLVGRLENLPLIELLHVLSMFRKSGELTVSRGDEIGVFLLNNGKLYHAANGLSAPSIGEVLLERNVISQETLDAALATQRLAPQRKKIGTILVEMDAVTRETLHSVLRDQLQQIAKDFIAWESGFFSFKFTDGPEEGDPGINDEAIKLTEVINIDPFILDLLKKVDAVGGGGSVRPVPKSRTGNADTTKSGYDLNQLLDFMVEPGPAVHNVEPSTEVIEWPSDLGDLRTLMTEIHVRPFASSGEIALLTLRYATGVVNRGVLFGVTSESVTGIGQFGIGRSDDTTPFVTDRIRQVQIPVAEHSVFSRVVERRVSYHGRLDQCPWNNYLVDQLGGTVPPEVILIPIVVNHEVAAIFYGDSLPGGHPITSIHGLELLMIEAGLAIEKNLLAERLRHIEAKIQKGGGRSSIHLEDD